MCSRTSTPYGAGAFGRMHPVGTTANRQETRETMAGVAALPLDDDDLGTDDVEMLLRIAKQDRIGRQRLHFETRDGRPFLVSGELRLTKTTEEPTPINQARNGYAKATTTAPEEPAPGEPQQPAGEPEPAGAGKDTPADVDAEAEALGAVPTGDLVPGLRDKPKRAPRRRVGMVGK